MPEVRQALVDEGVVRVMVGLLDRGAVVGAKEHAAECLQNLTVGNDGLRHAVVSEGGLRSLLLYLDGPLPQEPAVSVLRNLVGGRGRGQEGEREERREKGGGAHWGKIVFSHGSERFTDGKSNGVSYKE